MKIIIPVLLAVLVTADKPSPPPVTSDKQPGQFEAGVREGDFWWAKRNSAFETRKAVEAYKEALAMKPEDVRLLIQLSKANYWLASQILLEEAKPDSRELLKILQEGIDYAETAMKLAPDDPGGYFWSCVNLGRYHSVNGVSLKVLSLMGMLLERTKKVDKLDKVYYLAGVKRFWGRVIFELPWIVRATGGYGLKDGKVLMEEAIAVAPDFLANRRYYADYLLEMGEKDMARLEYEKIINSPPDIMKDFVPENRMEQVLARKTYKEEFGKK
jgi:tetratricopeptide (TPR) repeat protein